MTEHEHEEQIESKEGEVIHSEKSSNQGVETEENEEENDNA